MTISRKERANAIRALTMDAVQKANSGHPGAPMGMADIAEVLWHDYLRHNPSNPNWANRDRFILSNGHGSMLLYSLLHLTGYDLSIEDIKQFRQLDSKTPGHPEYGYTPGVETTTGPLGQGLANGVGMAIAEKIMAARYNKESFNIVDHYTYVFVGDGCLMEGISHEVCSLAGTLSLGKMIVFYDDNNISIDGDVSGWFTDDSIKRFEAYGWDVHADVDGHSPESIVSALDAARKSNKPSILCCKTIIGYGSPNKAGKESCHGAALGKDEVELTRESLGWESAAFDIPESFYEQWDNTDKGRGEESAWNALFEAYEVKYPKFAFEYRRRLSGDLSGDFIEGANNFIRECNNNKKEIATRKASQNALNAYGPFLPELIGGSADLTGSNLTLWNECSVLTADNVDSNYIYYGVREFGMKAIMNGLALYGGFIPYGATFLIFMEYGHNAVRMAAIMKKRVIFVYTHDSIGLGEDGPTHQPVEQLSALRVIPYMQTWRPCDEVESAIAWRDAICRKGGPSALVFSRHALRPMDRSTQQIEEVSKGGYILREASRGAVPDAIIIATGSEVALAEEAWNILVKEGVSVRLVSMPSTNIFDEQGDEYKLKVLPREVKCRVAIEASASDFWWKYVGLDGAVIGMTSFGESAPAKDLFKKFGFTVDRVVDTVNRLIA